MDPDAAALDLLAAAHPAAAELLVLAGFLGGEAVPLALVSAGAAGLPPRLAAAAGDAAALEEAAGALVNAGLATLSGGALTIGEATREVMTARLGDDERRAWAETAAAVAARAVPGAPEDADVRPAWDRFAPLALEAAETCRALGVGADPAAQLYSLLGRYALARGEPADARELLEHAVDLRGRARGPADPAVAMDLTYLNGALQGTGDRARMVANGRRVLEILEGALGPEHRTTVVHVNNLGVLLKNAGDLEGARAQFERAVPLAETAFGADSPFVATVSSNVGDALLRLGRPGEARGWLEWALEVDLAHYGEAGRSVARDLRRLGGVLVDLGERERARDLIRRAHAVLARELPPGDALLARLEAEIAALG